MVGKWPNAAPTQFPRRYWTSFHYSVAVLGEFVQATAPAAAGLPMIQWNSQSLHDELAGILAAADVTRELIELGELVEYRSGVMSEALQQRENLLRYWRGILMFNKRSHPWTCGLIDVALRVGQFQAMHYKRSFNRPRASQFSPSLLPPIDPPGHASFPSGHATEAHLMALCLKEVMPLEASAEAIPGNPDSAPLQRMAQRIARNREVLGLHYPSDSAAGKKLAEQTFRILKECPSVKDVQPAAPTTPTFISEAKKEWGR
jgi:hypothetical protein